MQFWAQRRSFQASPLRKWRIRQSAVTSNFATTRTPSIAAKAASTFSILLSYWRLRFFDGSCGAFKNSVAMSSRRGETARGAAPFPSWFNSFECWYRKTARWSSFDGCGPSLADNVLMWSTGVMPLGVVPMSWARVAHQQPPLHLIFLKSFATKLLAICRPKGGGRSPWRLRRICPREQRRVARRYCRSGRMRRWGCTAWMRCREFDLKFRADLPRVDRSRAGEGQNGAAGWVPLGETAKDSRLKLIGVWCILARLGSGLCLVL